MFKSRYVNVACICTYPPPPPIFYFELYGSVSIRNMFTPFSDKCKRKIKKRIQIDVLIK